ncbi:MAG: ISAzo13 family transposase [Lentisphaeria bacterium]|nr:ISAzo13 family transposase [Lentisphaeria bacterium]
MTRELLADNEALCKLLGDSARHSTSGERRRFKAGIVNVLGEGAQRWAETVLGWSRTTIRKGQRELATSNMIDPCYRGGRPRAEEILPTLLEDITAIVTPNLQQDPTFRTTHTYRRITAATVHEELLAKPGYARVLPCVRTISTKLNELDFAPARVAKSKPIKKIAETNAIFDHLHQVNAEADGNDEVLRLSIDAKAAIRVGPFSRGGLNRCGDAACDHDFAPLCVLQLLGLFIPQYDENFFFFNESRCTADLVVDCLEHVWPTLRTRYQSVKRLVINLDNGPEVQSRRTWFIKRIVDFAHSARIAISLAYYPPYHSKYNPVERVWGILENHWSGELLDSRAKVRDLARDMKWKGSHPQVITMPGTYSTGMRLTAKHMQEYERHLKRHPELGRWSVDIEPSIAR